MSSADPWYDGPGLTFETPNVTARVSVRYDGLPPPRLVRARFDNSGAGALGAGS